MANPIQPAGLGRNVDVFEEAARQDAERNRRANQEHERLTGQPARNYEPPDPLVTWEGHALPRDVASDGDSYDTSRSDNLARNLSDIFSVGTAEEEDLSEVYRDYSGGGYSEDNPTQIITNSVRNRNARNSQQRPQVVNVGEMVKQRAAQAQEKEELTKAIEERRGQVKDALSDLDL